MWKDRESIRWHTAYPTASAFPRTPGGVKSSHEMNINPPIRNNEGRKRVIILCFMIWVNPLFLIIEDKSENSKNGQILMFAV